MARDQMRLSIESKQAEADLQNKSAETQAKIALEEQKFEHQRLKAMMRAQRDEAVHQQQMRHGQEKHEADVATALAKAHVQAEAIKIKAAAQRAEAAKAEKTTKKTKKVHRVKRNDKTGKVETIETTSE